MKTNSFRTGNFLPLFLMLVLVFLVSGHQLIAQENDHEKSGKQKVNIHITKEIDGVKTTIDTSFTVDEDFDVHQWIDENDSEKDAKAASRKIEKEISISIPDIAESNESTLPDTIIVNGDTIFLSTDGENLKLMMEGMPDMAELNIEKFIEPDFQKPDNFRFHYGPEECPHLRIESHGGFPSFQPFMIPGFEELMGSGRPDQIVIKKKRHGKKIIISFKDNEHPEHQHHSYQKNEEDYSVNVPGQTRKKVIIRHDKKSEVDENAAIERIQDGDKEVIIIRKK